MNANQAEADKRIIAILKAARWMPLPEQRPHYPPRTVSMHFNNRSFDVGVSRWGSLTEGLLFLEATKGRLHRRPRSAAEENAAWPTGQMYIEYRDKLEQVLDAIITFARHVDLDNVGDLIAPVVSAAPRAYSEDYAAGAQGELGERFTSTINPASWYPRTVVH